MQDIGVSGLRLDELEDLHRGSARATGIRLRDNKRTVHVNLPPRPVGCSPDAL
ncbi:MAG TPA: hypothetical protein VFB29_13265 [Pseudolabrys sp.]|nr:hypothetical protein [Pseudolabrys sp.]